MKRRVLFPVALIDFYSYGTHAHMMTTGAKRCYETTISSSDTLHECNFAVFPPNEFFHGTEAVIFLVEASEAFRALMGLIDYVGVNIVCHEVA